MHLRSAKYIDKPLEVSGDVPVGVTTGGGMDISDSKLAMSNSILAESNNNTQQFTVDTTNYTKTATKPTTTPNKINTKFGNKDKITKHYNSFRYYANYPDRYSYCFDGSKRFLTLDYLPNTINTSYTINSKVTMNITTTNFIKLWKTKQLELKIINLVELSTFAAKEGKFDIALDRAKESLKSFNSLNAFMMQQKQSTQHGNGSFSSDTPNNNGINSYRNMDKVQTPMTTGVRLFELAIMVNSNLASQLKNNSHFEESLELFTQLCKMATGNPSTITLSNQTTISQPSSQQQSDAKFFLYRFGINIGNVLYDMKEYQRSLKYYRLTLDRLSSCGQGNLKIKLMNNISITILTMKGKADMDAITSLNLQLVDNLSTQPQQRDGNQVDQAQHQQQQQQPSITASKIRLDVCNSNHHKFGLYLIVCHYQRADLTSMMNILRGLVKVGICRHYKRVFDLDDSSIIKDGLQHRRHKRQQQQQVSTNASAVSSNEGRSNSSSATSLSAVTDTGSASHVTSTDWLQLQQQQQIASHNRYRPSVVKINRGNDIDRAETIVRQQQMPVMGASLGRENISNDSRNQLSVIDTTSFEGNATTTPSTIGSDIYKKTRLNPSTFVKSPLVLSTASLLTKLSVFEKVGQVMSCIQQDRLEMLIGEKHNQISGSLIMACNLLLEFDDLNLATNHTIRKSGIGNDTTETSVYKFCMKLLNSNETYKSLVCDLMINSISEMLKKKKYKLNEAIALLKDVEKSQANTKATDYHHTSGNAAAGENKPVISTGMGSITIRNDFNNSNVVLKSSMLATNSSLLYLLQNKPKEALASAELAVKLDRSNINAYINLANSHYYLNNLTQAKSLHQQANSLINHSTSWEANYNLALVGRKLGHHSEELKTFIKLMLSHNKLDFTSLTSQTMTIPKVQMALIYQQSGDYSQAITILDDLIKNSRQSPEVCLLFSKLLEEGDRNSITKTSPTSVLQQANRENPYHLPILARLIALNIKNFNYETAEELLRNCIRNRPQQVRWYQMLAECQRRATDYNKSIVTYKVAINMFPRDISCLKALIKLTGELGLIEENKFYTARLQRTVSQVDAQNI